MLSYTIRADSADPQKSIVASWTANRLFDLSADANVTVTIAGNTDITISGGTMSFDVDGSLDGATVVTFLKLLANGPVQWNMASAPQPLAAGGHLLDEDSIISWHPAAVNDTLTVTSEYDVAVDVPEPTSIFLVVAGLVGCYIPRQRRRSASGKTKRLK